MSFIHDDAVVENGATVGDGTRIWANSQVRPGAIIGRDCSIGRNVFVDQDVAIGDRVKIQNNASLFEGVTVESGAFIGPHVIFTNDRVPRAINPDGSPKGTDDWLLDTTTVERGASLGAGTVVVTGVRIGAWAMIGSSTVVTSDIEAHALVVGNPGRVIGWVSAAGVRCESQADARAASKREAEATTKGTAR